MQVLNKAMEFFNGWKARDWEKAYNACQITWKSNPGNTIDYLTDMLNSSQLFSFKLGKTHSCSNSGLLVRVNFGAVLYANENIISKEGIVTLVKEIKAYTPSKGGVWGVNPISILRGKVL